VFPRLGSHGGSWSPWLLDSGSPVREEKTVHLRSKSSRTGHLKAMQLGASVSSGGGLVPALRACKGVCWCLW
jgi:hypothetical protein